LKDYYRNSNGNINEIDANQLEEESDDNNNTDE